MCKRYQKYLYGLKKTCLGVLDRGNRDKDSEIGLEEGGGIETSTTVLHSRCSLLRLKYLPADDCLEVDLLRMQLNSYH